MPKPKTHKVVLSDDERRRLHDFTTAGIASAREIRRARILLLGDEDRLDTAIADAVGCCVATVERIRKRCAAEGVEAALVDRPRPGATPLLDGKGEAVLVALACTTPPEERDTWTMQLLADRLVALDVVDKISDETVRRTLKKTTSSPGIAKSGASAN
ncbi:MAG TPA: helix-turn-helix domain-containing protein [Thermomicrobiales bacterium]|nr:helix-turn-helix domain-containing protein [Thermomicrobiales bacterium]